MSYIDCHPHEIVGMLGSLPVYHPLNDIIGFDTDFSCSTTQLVVGGGCGEHPGLVLLNPEDAVVQFVLHSEDFMISQDQEIELFAKHLCEERFNFVGWSSKHHHHFYQLCTSTALPNKFQPDSGIDFETWLHLGFGEFIYYAMPELATTFIEKVKPLHSESKHMLYNNIMLLPPNIPVYANGGNAFFKG